MTKQVPLGVRIDPKIKKTAKLRAKKNKRSFAKQVEQDLDNANKKEIIPHYEVNSRLEIPVRYELRE